MILRSDRTDRKWELIWWNEEKKLSEMRTEDGSHKLPFTKTILHSEDITGHLCFNILLSHRISKEVFDQNRTKVSQTISILCWNETFWWWICINTFFRILAQNCLILHLDVKEKKNETNVSSWSWMGNLHNGQNWLNLSRPAVAQPFVQPSELV